MAEKQKRPDLIKQYLDRLKVQEKSATAGEYSQRLTHLSAVRSALAELTRKGFAVAEGPSFIDAEGESPELSSLAPPDYVVLREDVLLYVYVNIDEKRELSAEFAKAIWEALRENSSLSAVAVAWPGLGYPSVCIDSFAVRNYLETVLLILARVLICSMFSAVDFMMIDEPLEHLDSRNRRSVLNFLVAATRRGLIKQAIVTTFEESLVRKYLDQDLAITYLPALRT